MLRFLSFALAAALLTTACGDDDDAVSITEEQLVGTWTVESADNSVRLSTNGVNTLSSTGQTETSDATVTFDADGTFTSSGVVAFTQTTTNAGISVPSGDASVRFGRGSWSLDGTTVTLSDGGFLPDLGVLAAFVSVDAVGGDTEVTAFEPGARLTLVSRVDTTIVQDNPIGGPSISLRVEGEQTTVLTQ